MFVKYVVSNTVYMCYCFSQLRLVALNYPITGQMGSLGGIDSQCLRQSEKAGLAGTFRAFLSNKLQHIYTIVPRAHRDLPVANLKVSCTRNGKNSKKISFINERTMKINLVVQT